jgi:hypothetical protein
LNQDIVFVPKIQVDSSISDTCLLGNLGNGCLKKALLCKDFDSCLEDSVVLIVEFPFGINNARSLKN